VKLGDKLHVVVCTDLGLGAQGCQAIHAAIQFTFEHPEVCGEWFRDSNYLAFLEVQNEREL
jgi:hypothetical protein